MSATTIRRCCCGCAGKPCTHCRPMPSPDPNLTPKTLDVKIRGLTIQPCILCGDGNLWRLGYWYVDIWAYWYDLSADLINGQYCFVQSSSDPCKWTWCCARDLTVRHLQVVPGRENPCDGNAIDGGYYAFLCGEVTRTSPTAGRLRWFLRGRYGDFEQTILEADLTWEADCRGGFVASSITGRPITCADESGRPQFFTAAGTTISATACCCTLNCQDNNVISLGVLHPPVEEVFSLCPTCAPGEYPSPYPQWDGSFQFTQCCCNYQPYRSWNGVELYLVANQTQDLCGRKYFGIWLYCNHSWQVGAYWQQDLKLIWHGRKYCGSNHLGVYDHYEGCLDVEAWTLE